ncbi:MAG: hypothetical protein ABI818_04950 [Acidobacteriota bacterium]
MRPVFAALVPVWIAASLLVPLTASAQNEGKIQAELRRERERLAEKCGQFSLSKVFGCAQTLVTDHPFHVAVGSVAPQNGFGAGLAFVGPQSKPNENWRINWSADAVGTASSAWRAGAYATFVNTRVAPIVPTRPGGGTSTSDAMPRPYPTISAYAQVTSLSRLSFYGLGNDTSVADRTAFAMRQSAIGARVFWPLGGSGFFNRLNPTAIGEVNERLLQVGGSTRGGDPSIDTRFTDATAPGLSIHPSTLQLGEGLRVTPAVGRLQLNYTGMLQQYIAPSDSHLSFRRWSLDLRHEFSLYTTSVQSGGGEQNSPNDCAASANRTIGEYGCPDATLVTRNRVGTVGFRALVSRSGVSSGNQVPFYFQRTIGGSDIDGERLLAGYDDYRFRGPNLMVLQQTFEQVIWGPLGVFAAAEQGRVSLIDDPLSKGELRKTIGAGLTLRAGGIPMVTIWWADSRREGHHIAFTVNTSLLGGSSRPSLR